ncbi:MAG: hypothetical protein A2268_12045 [Candidatus Raymondbacteria bacterium RifOxyA12_full_50_37]|uniref:Inositol-1-monophosphatase n=1 Tax=Candidatus Raymondbacteria bacterium RIFOXYD12_FULL_49_13 TaxID=1817890 RepID=A0A1F7F0L0_UNCRA|nr:MAG: hypothetical protein A2268_12045 [Candidatus Raymondbacteria bacterium RifOxyA12_full_50_37]OGJ86049.1 MAG: hypothetical protein A2248_02040 [Candidatus Raymondbacteria bacterium RIFOXYA2_FULL_49_16]OGJ95946.1 MAG: hypothetical protein A2453_05445 [Candidatus Raymondbacteria bacterium RIFOXYC2_FULL_50_21]OGJ98358.1 MAG: hypothetical protein A2350_11405 [Candidatus Raymondbacteria bacterium RifOxyB12_full_50_8]OGK00194.1 MAG: hypothetical protein A2519_20495 [Candidatus Raymondbacteria b
MIARTAIAAAAKAAAIIRGHFGKVDESDIETKGINDFVSFVDREAEAAIVSVIREAFPGHALQTEETEGIQGTGDVRWIIDPLDGTTNFLRGHPRFAVSIGVYQGAKPLFGIVHDVMQIELFTAQAGGGAYVNGRRMFTSTVADARDALVLFGSPFRKTDDIGPFTELFGSIQKTAGDQRREGAAALDLAYVAAGRAEAFYELGLKPWDIAAGSVLVQEAGGWIGDFYGENADLYRDTVLATNQDLKECFLGLCGTFRH